MNKMPRLQNDMPDTVVEKVSSDETVKRIRKLRWIGMIDEARSLELQLKRIPAVGKAGALAGPYSTD
jgi:hypothetical protein